MLAPWRTDSGHCRTPPPRAVPRGVPRGRADATTMLAFPRCRRAAMSRHAAPPYLDEASIERLADLLDRRAVPFKGFNLEALDGFLTALAVSPSPVPPEEWQPVVWGGKTPRWDGEEEAREVEQLLLGHANMCIARVR